MDIEMDDHVVVDEVPAEEVQPQPQVQQPPVPPQAAMTLAALIANGALTNVLPVPDDKLTVATVTYEKLTAMEAANSTRNIPMMGDVLIFITMDLCGSTSVAEVLENLSTDNKEMPSTWSKVACNLIYASLPDDVTPMNLSTF